MLNQDKENQIESLLYSDGLFSFTLYCGHSIIPNIPENAWKQGSTTFYSETKENKEFTLLVNCQFQRRNALCKIFDI